MNHYLRIFITLLTFGFLLIISSCKKEDNTKAACGVNNPAKDIAWLATKIGEMDGSASAGSNVKVYTYNGDEVFYLEDCPNTCADQFSFVYNCEGAELCRFGGFAGVNTCTDFDNTATLLKQVWP